MGFTACNELKIDVSAPDGKCEPRNSENGRNPRDQPMHRIDTSSLSTPGAECDEGRILRLSLIGELLKPECCLA